jgi:multiple sugar transport system permease protein
MRALLLAPWLLPIVVSASVWRWMFAQDTGIINYVLLSAGIVSEPVPWLIEPAYALCAVILTNIWIGIPFSMAVFHSGLQALPKEIFEAAEIDGANAWQRFWRIRLPLISPTIFFATVMTAITSLQVFDEIFAMTRGGPGSATATLGFAIYQKGFTNFQMGYASALAWVMFVMIMALTILQFHMQRKWVHYDD